MAIDATELLKAVGPETEIRYIKLGRGGSEEADCLARGELRLFFHLIPHEAALMGDREAMLAAVRAEKAHKGTATSQVTQVSDFYALDEHTLWITFADGQLWWAFADPQVHWIEEETRAYRMRKAIGGWRNTDLKGDALYTADLSGRLAKTALYRGTICQVEAREYLLQRLNAEPSEAVRHASGARTSLVDAVETLVRGLSWRDFEILVDLIFAQSGWRRINALGGVEKTTDLELIQPITGERAFVQVKSRSKPKEFVHYLRAFEARRDRYMFYVYHSGPVLSAPENPHCILIDARRVAEMALDAGLYEWLAKRAA